MSTGAQFVDFKSTEVRRHCIGGVSATELRQCFDDFRNFITGLLPAVKDVVKVGGTLDDPSLQVPSRLFDVLLRVPRPLNAPALTALELEEVVQLTQQITRLRVESDKYVQHIKYWGHQAVRFAEELDRVTTTCWLIVIDFKEKLRTKQSAAQRQRDYFGGEYMSLFNVTVYYRTPDGELHKKHLDFINPVHTRQDTFWVESAFCILVEQLNSLIVSEIGAQALDASPYVPYRILPSCFRSRFRLFCVRSCVFVGVSFFFPVVTRAHRVGVERLCASSFRCRP
eukprot:103063-Pyramimonas_sp.AAC.1